MTEESRPAGRRRMVPATVTAVAVLAAGAHLWLNTDVLGREEVCGGLVSTEAVEELLGGFGRVSDRNPPDVRSGRTADGRLDVHCTVENTSFLLGTRTARLEFWINQERGVAPFEDNGRWPAPAATSFFSGPATGAVAGSRGWVLLPEDCGTPDGPAVVEGSAPEGSDPLELARVLTGIAASAAEASSCGPDEPLAAPDALVTPPKARPAGDGPLCGVENLRFPGPERSRAGVTQRLQDEADPVWACEVGDYASYAVTQDPHVVAAIRSSPVFTEQPSVAGLRVSGLDPQQLVADCAGTPTYFAVEFGDGYRSAREASEAPALRELTDSFVAAAGKRFGCPTESSGRSAEQAG